MKTKKTVLVAFLIFFSIFITQLSEGSEDPTYQELLREIKSLKNRVADLEEKLAVQAAKFQPVSSVKAAESSQKDSPVTYDPEEGLTIVPMDFNIKTNAVGILQGTPNANNAGAGEDSQFDASWKVCFELNKGFYDWGHAFMELELGQGNTIVDELNLFSNVNNNASDTGANVLASKFWYSHYFFDKQFNVTCGKLDPTDWQDQNVFADDDSTQFLGSIFDNCAAIEWPSDNAFGVNVNASFEPISFLEFDLTFCEADADWEDVFEHGYYAAQVTLKPASLLGLDSEMWEGNYRFYSWLIRVITQRLPLAVLPLQIQNIGTMESVQTLIKD